MTTAHLTRESGTLIRPLNDVIIGGAERGEQAAHPHTVNALIETR